MIMCIVIANNNWIHFRAPLKTPEKVRTHRIFLNKNVDLKGFLLFSKIGSYNKSEFLEVPFNILIGILF